MYEDTTNMEFPQFRKLKNGRSLYQITAPNAFTELQSVGSKWFKYEFEVSQFPDLLRIQEMIQSQDVFLPCTREEFHEIYKQL